MAATAQLASPNNSPPNGAPTKKNAAPLNLQFVWLLFGVLAIEVVRSQNFEHLEPLEMALGLGITVLCFLPGFIWASQSEREPPAFQLFCAVHYPYYAYPIITAQSAYMRLATIDRLMAGAIVAVFLLTAVIVYYINRPKDFCTRPTTILQLREIPERSATHLAFAMLGIWGTFTVAFNFGYLREMMTPAYANVINTVMMGAGTMGTWTLARQCGARKLSVTEIMLFLVMFAVPLIVILATLMMVQVMTYIAVALISYTMGRGRVPWFLVAVGLMLFAFLNFGKGQTRDKFWIGGHSNAVSLSIIGETYSTWFSASFHTMLSADQKEYESRSIFARANLIQVLGRVHSFVPGRKPFMFGETYLYIPQLVVPRVFWKDKPAVHVANNLIGVNCGLTTRDNLRSTTVSVGLIAEAWVNFGWVGVIGLGLLIGSVMRFMGSACASAAPTMLHSMAAVVWIAYSFQIEMVTSAWCSSFTQAMGVLVAMMYPFSHPVAKPKSGANNQAGAIPSSTQAAATS